MKSLIVVGFLTIGMMQTTVNAQTQSDQSPKESTQSPTDIAFLYGNQQQPGTKVHQAINDLVAQGTPLNTSISNVIDQIIASKGTVSLPSGALTSVTQNTATFLAFMTNMLATNDLFAATKLSIENNPDDINNIINISVVLYPDLAQEVINASVITGEIDSDDALLAAIGAGADPTTVSEATAAGGAVTNVAGLPLGGLGGGGSGNEDPSASNN